MKLINNQRSEMKQETGKRKKWLRRVGLIFGLAGMSEVIAWGLFHYEGGPSWVAILPLSVYIAPFVAGLVVSWMWPLGGGVMLVVIASFWLAFITYTRFSTPITQPIMELLSYIAKFTLPLILPQMVTGILFLLSLEKEHGERNK